MMGLTRKGEYAIRGMVYLARKPIGETTQVSEIARAVNVPPAFLAKIFQDFSRLGLIRSYRGSGGGVILGRAAEQITLREVVEAIEGPILPNCCLIADNECEYGTQCRVHPVWRKVQTQVIGILDSVTLKELARQ